VVVEEPDRVARRELERARRLGRPERGGERDEEVAAEALRVPVLVEVAAERPAVQILLVERPAGGAQPAPDLPEEPVEVGARRVPSLRERPPAAYSSPRGS
jgi:hypothetical protein